MSSWLILVGNMYTLFLVNDNLTVWQKTLFAQLKTQVIPLILIHFLKLIVSLPICLCSIAMPHTATGERPSWISKSLNIRSTFECIRSADVGYFRDNDLNMAIGIVISTNKNRMCVTVDLYYLSSQRGNVDCVLQWWGSVWSQISRYFIRYYDLNACESENI